jgi:hypothetical protein
MSVSVLCWLFHETAHSLRGFEEKMEPMFFDSENYQKTESENSLIPRFSKN